MVTWTESQLRDHERKQNRPQNKTPGTVSKCDVQHEPLGKVKREKENPGRFLVSITSYRRRLLDPDNQLFKWHIDCLRYAGYIPNDRPEDIELVIKPQEKVLSKESEHVLITVERI